MGQLDSVDLFHSACMALFDSFGCFRFDTVRWDLRVGGLSLKHVQLYTLHNA